MTQTDIPPVPDSSGVETTPDSVPVTLTAEEAVLILLFTGISFSGKGLNIVNRETYDVLASLEDKLLAQGVRKPALPTSRPAENGGARVMSDGPPPEHRH